MAAQRDAHVRTHSNPTTQEESEGKVDLAALSTALLAEAREASAGRATRMVRGGAGLLRQVVIALRADAELAEHDSPPEAALQVLDGRIRLIGTDRHWDVARGGLVPIPPERHSVTALEDSVFLLTVRRAAAPDQDDQQGEKR